MLPLPELRIFMRDARRQDSVCHLRQALQLADEVCVPHFGSSMQPRSGVRSSGQLASSRPDYRWRSPAAGNGSDEGAYAVGSQVQRCVRLCI